MLRLLRDTMLAELATGILATSDMVGWDYASSSQASHISCSMIPGPSGVVDGIRQRGYIIC